MAVGQTYEWDYAYRGGGSVPFNSNMPATDWRGVERVIDMEVDGSGNSFVLCYSGNGTAADPTNYNGTTYDQYNGSFGGRDVLLLKLDCRGNFLWSKAFGGGNEDFANSLSLDASGSVYVGGFTQAVSARSGDLVHFAQDSIIPGAPVTTLDDGPWHKRLFVIKYNNNGVFQWLRRPEKEQSNIFQNFDVSYGDVRVEGNGTSHFLCRMTPGANVNGQLTITGSESEWHIVRYDTVGNYLGNTPLDFGGLRAPAGLSMAYDANLSRYIMGLWNVNGVTFDVDGTPRNSGMVLLASDLAGNTIWRIDDTDSGASAHILDIVVDANSDIYFCGRMFQPPNNPNTPSMASYIPSATNNIGYLLKLDSAGNLIWGTNAGLGSSEFGHGIALNGNEVALAGSFGDGFWKNTEIIPRTGNRAKFKPALIRLNASNGSLIEVVRVDGDPTVEDQMTAVAVDQYGNYVTGGYMNGPLFTNTPGITPLQRNDNRLADFFVARYATTDCNGVPLSSNTIEQQPDIRLAFNPVGSHARILGIETGKVEIYDLTGKLLKSQLMEQRQEIDTSRLGSGIYLLMVNDGAVNSKTLKMVKK